MKLNLTHAYILVGAINAGAAIVMTITYFLTDSDAYRVMLAAFILLHSVVTYLSLRFSTLWQDPATYQPNSSYSTLPAAYQLAVDKAIQQCLKTHYPVAFAIDNQADVYAYKVFKVGDHKILDHICWGVNGGPGGYSVAREIYLPD